MAKLLQTRSTLPTKKILTSVVRPRVVHVGAVECGCSAVCWLNDAKLALCGEEDNAA
jgi:hypothetical protein